VQTGVSENGFTAVTLPAKFNESGKVVLKGAYDLLSKMNNMEEEE
jgi:cobalt-zinc-cadmium efflux system membrane fusion protein